MLRRCYCYKLGFVDIFLFFLFFYLNRNARGNAKLHSKFKSPFLCVGGADAVYNIQEWLAPHAEQLHDHTQPKCFKFIRNAAGKCEMFYRNYSHMPWEGPVVILKVQLWSL